LTAHLATLDRDLDSEALKIDDGCEYCDRGEEVHNVRQSLTVEGLLQSTALVTIREEEVEERDDGALEFRPSTRVDGSGRKGLPDDRLADVGGDEERDPGAEPEAFGKKLVEEDNDERGGDELEDQEQADAGAEGRGGSIETGEDVDRCLAERNDKSEHCTDEHQRGSHLAER